MHAIWHRQFGLLFLGLFKEFIYLWIGTFLYTLSRIKMLGRRMSPRCMYSKKTTEFLHKQIKHIIEDRVKLSLCLFYILFSLSDSFSSRWCEYSRILNIRLDLERREGKIHLMWMTRLLTRLALQELVQIPISYTFIPN